MSTNHYTEISTSLGLQLEALPHYDLHRNISTRGISFVTASNIDISTILRISLKLISMTGSIEFLVKVLKVIPLTDGSGFEIHANFYDTNAAKEEELLDLIRNI